MKQSFKTGIAFGVTSGVITTLGLLVGLSFSSGMKLIVIWGILTIAVADSLSDALGIHVSQESDKKNKADHIRESTITTFIVKFVIACSFLIPVFIFDLTTATIIGVVWWLLLLTILSYIIAKSQKKSPLHAIFEHVGIWALVVVITYFIGIFISSKFGA